MNTKHPPAHLRALIVTAALGAVTTGFAAIAAAQDSANVRGDQVSEQVSYGDLNLSRHAGATTLYHRIVTAAHDVCDEPYDTLATRAEARACLDKAIADAVMTSGHPELIAVYNSSKGHTPPITLAAAQHR